MKQSDILYIKSYLTTYYHRSYDKLFGMIKKPEMREWAILNIDGKMIRHLHIPSLDSFRDLLSNYIPKGLYHSASYYEHPSEDMDLKHRLKTDVIFDLDADHMPRVEIKEVYKCKNEECGEYGDREKCVICGDATKKIIVVDDVVIDSVKKELKRLVKTLYDILGIEESMTKVFFSGLRGFHIHIEDGPLLDMDDIERINLKDFITLDDVDISLVRDENAFLLSRLIEELPILLKEVSDIELKTVLKKIDELKDDRKKVFLFIKDLRSDEELLAKLNHFITSSLGIGVDPAVLTDLSRLIRAPLSLHGRSGLIKIPVKPSNVDDVSIIGEAMPTNVKCKVYIHYLPQIVWGGEEYGPFYREYTLLPESLAIYMVNLGLGESLSIP